MTAQSYTFLILIVKVLCRLMCSAGLLMVQVLLMTSPGVMSSKSNEANCPGLQKELLLAGSFGSSNLNVITSKDSIVVLMQFKRCTANACRQKISIGLLLGTLPLHRPQKLFSIHEGSIMVPEGTGLFAVGFHANSTTCETITMLS